MDKFVIHSPFKPTGDQPEAIEALANGVLNPKASVTRGEMAHALHEFAVYRQG